MKLTFNEAQLTRDIGDQIAAVQQPVEEAMAAEFRSCVSDNFGFVGFERPTVWAPLSNRSEIGRRYIQKVGRTVATLEETGAMKSNLIATGNKVELTADGKADYALDHEHGVPGRALPARPVFPIINGDCMPKSYARVVDAAAKVINEKLT
jgi:hypothetical protein